MQGNESSLDLVDPSSLSLLSPTSSNTVNPRVFNSVTDLAEADINADLDRAEEIKEVEEEIKRIEEEQKQLEEDLEARTTHKQKALINQAAEVLDVIDENEAEEDLLS